MNEVIITAHLTDKLWDGFSKDTKLNYTQTRPIVIPDEEIKKVPVDENIVKSILELAFQYGQNDFQPVPNRRSVSVGDIVEITDKTETRYFKVESIGWSEVDKEVLK